MDNICPDCGPFGESKCQACNGTGESNGNLTEYLSHIGDGDDWQYEAFDGAGICSTCNGTSFVEYEDE